MLNSRTNQTNESELIKPKYWKIMLPEKNHSAVFSGPRNFKIKDLPISSKDSNVLLKTLSCAVCGYDVRVFKEGHKKVRPPIVLGH